MLYWGPDKTIYDNWRKGSHSLLDRGAIRYKMAHYIGVLWYTKKIQQKMDSQSGSTEACFTRRQYGNTSQVKGINKVAITKKNAHVQDWMQTLQK